jgi:hypothetical protein
MRGWTSLTDAASNSGSQLRFRRCALEAAFGRVDPAAKTERCFGIKERIISVYQHSR